MALFLIMPFLRGYLKVHESVIIMLIFVLMAATKAALPFTTELWQYYVVQVKIMSQLLSAMPN